MTLTAMRGRSLVLTLLLLFAAVTAATATAHADSLQNPGVSLTGPDGTFSRQAGAHADFRTHLEFAALQPPEVPIARPAQAVRDVRVDLPPGLYGNPTAVQTCTAAQLVDGDPKGSVPGCPIASQVGVALISTIPGLVSYHIPVFNMERPGELPELPGLFAMNFQGSVIQIEANVRPTDYGITALSPRISQALSIFGVDLTLWGVPADPSHDAERAIPASNLRGIASPAARLPFMTNPTSCPDAPVQTTISTDFWDAPGVFSSVVLDSDIEGTPFVMGGCDHVPFDPSVTLSPMSTAADAPTGLNVELSVPQSNSPDGLSSATVRRVAVELPDGFSVSPSSADGLGGCAPEQIMLGSNDAPTCPDSSTMSSSRPRTTTRSTV
jgi:hypothetical protein